MIRDCSGLPLEEKEDLPKTKEESIPIFSLFCRLSFAAQSPLLWIFLDPFPRPLLHSAPSVNYLLLLLLLLLAQIQSLWSPLPPSPKRYHLSFNS